jgi:hypothetical protein
VIQFIPQVIEAFREAKHKGDLRPLNAVVESWFRTMMFATRPNFDALWDEATKTESPRYSLEDIRRRRAQRAR